MTLRTKEEKAFPPRRVPRQVGIALDPDAITRSSVPSSSCWASSRCVFEQLKVTSDTPAETARSPRQYVERDRRNRRRPTISPRLQLRALSPPSPHRPAPSNHPRIRPADTAPFPSAPPNRRGQPIGTTADSVLPSLWIC